ncbi:ABC transporter substrate-binding protein [Streptomyces odontomachi]|uniref:ABC transporter substrate-binding protein n=1 Tax=Streptomyces odontomachi TaxID=2944940 RepID=UPI00210E6BCC|nr:extracellular solute-binding protein [Streptomyces sp. ODS25]
MKSQTRVRGRWSFAVLTVGALVLSGCSAGGLVGGADDEGGGGTLTFLADDSEASTALAKGLADAFEAAHEGVTVKVESRPQGSEGDNVIKTRLSTGDMSDVFMYNAGSLFQALHPAQKLVPLDRSADLGDVEDSFLKTVTDQGKVYGAPFGTAQGGGLLYNRAVYRDLGLKVPRTWDAFMANNEKIKKSGRAPVIQTYEDTWTAQLFVLGDFHNVAAADPHWADKYTKNQVKYAQEPAIEGFRHLAELHKAGYYNKDFASANLTDGLELLAQGKGVQYPILSGSLPGLTNAFPDKAKDVGFFPVPGDDAAKNGLTVWPGLAGVYVPKTTEGDKLDLAKEFVRFVASARGCTAQGKAYAPTGPYLVKGCTLPADVPPAVRDIKRYFDEGRTTPALEYLSPVKGPALEQICVEVGSGITSADKGARLYDEDVKKQAQQLDLPGWQ